MEALKSVLVGLGMVAGSIMMFFVFSVLDLNEDQAIVVWFVLWAGLFACIHYRQSSRKGKNETSN